MSKFMKRVRELQASNPKYADMTTDDVVDIEASKLQSSLANERREKNKLLKEVNKPPLTVEVTADGKLQTTKSLSDGIGFSGNIPRVEIMHSKTLQGLCDLMRPLLATAKAITNADGVIKNAPLHRRNEEGNLTKDSLLTPDGKQIFNSDPLSKFKVLISILDNNKEAQEAIATISNVLREQKERANRLSVTQDIIKAKSSDEIYKEFVQMSRDIETPDQNGNIPEFVE